LRDFETPSISREGWDDLKEETLKLFPLYGKARMG